MRAAFVVPEPSGGRLEIRDVELPHLATGVIKVPIEQSFPLADIAAALISPKRTAKSARSF